MPDRLDYHAVHEATRRLREDIQTRLRTESMTMPERHRLITRWVRLGRYQTYVGLREEFRPD